MPSTAVDFVNSTVATTRSLPVSPQIRSVRRSRTYHLHRPSPQLRLDLPFPQEYRKPLVPTIVARLPPQNCAACARGAIPTSNPAENAQYANYAKVSLHQRLPFRTTLVALLFDLIVHIGRSGRLRNHICSIVNNQTIPVLLPS